MIAAVKSSITKSSHFLFYSFHQNLLIIELTASLISKHCLAVYSVHAAVVVGITCWCVVVVEIRIMWLYTVSRITTCTVPHVLESSVVKNNDANVRILSLCNKLFHISILCYSSYFIFYIELHISMALKQLIVNL